jgi:tetratricopeptide (TPR) repeat protein
MGEVRSALAENATIDRQLLKFGKVEDLPLHHRINYATLLLRAARVPDAAAMLNGIVDRARDAGNSVVLAHALLSSGAVAVDLREWQEAERELDETAAISATNDRGTAALAEALLAQLNLGRDMLPSAHHHYQRALELAGYESEKPARTLARVLLTASRVAQSEHAPQDAQRFARDALAISESVARGADTCADVGEALLRLAEVQLSVDQHAAVRPVLARAERCLTNGLDANHPLSREARRLLGSVEG